MTLGNGIQALKNLEQHYSTTIKEALEGKRKATKNEMNRWGQIREGVKQSIAMLEKLKDKNADIIPTRADVIPVKARSAGAVKTLQTFS